MSRVTRKVLSLKCTIDSAVSIALVLALFLSDMSIAADTVPLGNCQDVLAATSRLAPVCEVSHKGNGFSVEKTDSTEEFRYKANGQYSSRLSDRARAFSKFLSQEGLEQLLERQLHTTEQVTEKFREVAGLLSEPYVSHDMAVKHVVNPDEKPLVAVYGGAGSDISNFLFSTDSTEAYFISDYKGMSEKDLAFCFLGNVQQYIAGSLRSDIYRKKFYAGFVSAAALGEKNEIIAAVAYELLSIGVDAARIRIDNNGGYPRIKFRWKYPRSHGEKDYSITFVGADITKPEQYEDVLFKRLLCGRGIDIYYQRAGRDIAASYVKDTCFLHTIYEWIRPGGFFATDDHAYRAGIQTYIASIFKDMSGDFPIRSCGETAVLDDARMAKLKKAILRIRHTYLNDPPVHYGWEVRVRKKPVMGEEPSAEGRTGEFSADAALLRAPYIKHDIAVKCVVNPENRPLVAVYGGAGADVSNFFLSTNASEAYFISWYKGMLSDDLEECFNKDPEEYIYTHLQRNIYVDKAKYGFANGDALQKKDEIVAALAYELLSIGVDVKKICVDNNDGYPRIRFSWRYPGSNSENERSVTFVEADVTKPELYEDALFEGLMKGRPIDIYYQRAGMGIAGSYISKNAIYIFAIEEHLKPEGYFVTDDYVYWYDYFSGRNVYMDHGGDLPCISFSEKEVLDKEAMKRIRGMIMKENYRDISPDPYNERSVYDDTQREMQISLLNYGWHVRVRQKRDIRKVVQEFVDELVIRVFETRSNGEKVIIGLDTSWIPEEAKVEGFQALLNAVSRLQQQSGGIKNLIVKVGKGEELAGEVVREIDHNGIRPENVIFLGNNDEIENVSFKTLREKKVFFFGIDPRKISSDKHKYDGKASYIRMIDILRAAAILAFSGAGPGVSDIPGMEEIIKKGDRYWVFVPKAERYFINILTSEYQRESEALHFA